MHAIDGSNTARELQSGKPFHEYHGWARHTTCRAIRHWIARHKSCTASLAITFPTLKWFAMDLQLYGVVSFHIVIAMHSFMDKGMLMTVVHDDLQVTMMICFLQLLLVSLTQKWCFMVWCHSHICPVTVWWPKVKSFSGRQLLLQTRVHRLSILCQGACTQGSPLQILSHCSWH